MFRYKLVIDDERWIEDPNNWVKTEDETGSLVSVLFGV